MSEKARVPAKSLEPKRVNPVSRSQKVGPSQSVGSHVEQVLFLQRTIGNQAVGRLIKSGALQAKLKIGLPGDKYEQEADRVAEQVMRMPEPQVSRVSGMAAGDTVQRQCPRCAKRTGRDEEKEVLQSKEASGQTPEVTSEVENSISSIRGGGQPLPESVRAFFEPRFGRDFSGVRVHTDAKAAEAARAVNARAFTVGRDVVFGEGQYAPETSGGRRLLTHELSHVVQQQINGSFRFSSAILQRTLKYIEQVTGDEAKPYLEKFDSSLKEIENFLKNMKGKEAYELREAAERLRTLRAAGKVTCWHTSGGLYLASYDNSSGELRLHIDFKGFTSQLKLIHEAIHAVHAARYPKLSQMYGKALETGEKLEENRGIMLLKWKAWTEYWAYYRTVEYENLRLAPEFRKKPYLKNPHEEAINERDVKASIAKVKELTDKDFKPWEWGPPASYKAKTGTGKPSPKSR